MIAYVPHPVTSSTTFKTPVRVGLISLGCAKNLVDAEVMLGALLKSGAEITNDPTTADVVIVNTCSFIDAAQGRAWMPSLSPTPFGKPTIGGRL